jgi:MoxR-like ATPase
MSVSPPVPEQVLDLQAIAELQRRATTVFIDRSVQQYAVDLVHATRVPAAVGMGDLQSVIALGASPRATLALVRGAKSLALLRGRTYAMPQDVFDIAPEVLRHRLILTYDALARDVSIEHVLSRVLSTVPTMWVSPKPNSTRV